MTEKLNIREAAKLVGVAEKTLYRAISRGNLASSRGCAKYRDRPMVKIEKVLEAIRDGRIRAKRGAYESGA